VILLNQLVFLYPHLEYHYHQVTGNSKKYFWRFTHQLVGSILCSIQTTLIQEYSVIWHVHVVQSSRSILRLHLTQQNSIQQ